MSVLIKGMEMPKNCLACDWCVHTIPADNYICYRLNRAVIGVAKEDVNETVNVCCPLVPVPPHGDLIDKDATMNAILEERGEDTACWFAGIVNDMPAIIPAEED